MFCKHICYIWMIIKTSGTLNKIVIHFIAIFACFQSAYYCCFMLSEKETISLRFINETIIFVVNAITDPKQVLI